MPIRKARVISFHFQSQVVSLNSLLSLCFLTYGVLPKRLLVATIIMSVLHSRFTWLHLIKHKSNVFDVFIQFQAHVECLLKHKILHVQSEWE
jgi:hypothetical protein